MNNQILLVWLALGLLIQGLAGQSTAISVFQNGGPETIENPDVTAGALRSRILTSEVANMSLAELDRIHLDLFEDVRLTIDIEARDHKHLVDVDLFYGRTEGGHLEHPDHYRDVIITVNRQTRKMVMVVQSERGLFQVLPSLDTDEYVVKEFDNRWVTSNCSTVIDAENGFNYYPPEMISGCNEQDANGDYVIDYLTGFSHEAVQDVGDINAYSVAQMETVNQGLANSLVSGVYLRLVDVSVRDGHAGVVSSWLSDGFALFEPDLIAVGADMLALYQRPRAGVSNAGGWGWQPGRTSVNTAGSPTVFRHECGHNSGSAHCPGDGGVAAYSAGFNNGSVATHMCGNNINYFSNPNISVSGAPIGNVATADNARLWRERGVILASYSQHVVPYDASDTGTANCSGPISDGVYFIQNVASGNYLQPNNNGATGSKLYQSATNGTNLEQWEFRQYSGNVYLIYNRSSKRVVDVFGSSSNTGPNVGLWTAANSNNQRWTVEETGNGTYTLTSNSSRKCLYVDASMSNAGDEVWQSECDGTTNAEWLITAVMPAPALLTIDLATSSATCNSSTNGSIIATVSNASGTQTYEWSNGATTPTIINTSAGAYDLTVTDAGIRYFKTASILSSAPLLPEMTITDARTSTGGSIDITAVQNATGVLSYAWSDGGPNSPVRNNLSAGDYTVTITDGNGCQDVRDIRIEFAPDDDNYVLQHVATGLYLSTLNEGNANETPVVLGECPSDNYNWFVYRNGTNGTVFRLRHVNSNRGFTVFGRNNIGEGYYIGNDANISTHRHIMHHVSGNIFELQSQSTGYYAQPESAEVSSEIVLGELDGSNNFQFLLIPIPDNCSPAAGTVCDDGEGNTENDEITILCDCCGEFNPALPVAYRDFYGRVRPEGNALFWSTATETNNQGFYVQRSLDGSNFQNIGFVIGQGRGGAGHSYDFLDEEPPDGQAFYRLRQVDFDGSTSLSTIVMLSRVANKVSTWSVFPNPVGINQSVLTVKGEGTTSLQLELLSIAGQQLGSYSVQLDETEQALISLANLPPGVYLLRDQLGGEVKRLVLQ